MPVLNEVAKQVCQHQKQRFETHDADSNFISFLKKRLLGFQEVKSFHTASFCEDDVNKICDKLLQIKRLQNVITSRKLHSGDVICFSERYFAMFGCASLILRNLFFRSLRWALRPRIFHASYVNQADKSNLFFEAVVVAYLQEDVWKSVLEDYIDLWKMSVGVIDLETYMSRPFITAIKRIIDGRSIYGNWMTLKNSTARIMWSTNFHRFEEQDARERVLNETGRTFTTGNMLSLYYDLRNAQISQNHLLAIIEVLLHDTSLIRSRATDHSNSLQQNRQLLSEAWRQLNSQDSDIDLTNAMSSLDAAGVNSVRIVNMLNSLLSRPQLMEVAQEMSNNQNQARNAMVRHMLQQQTRTTRTVASSMPVRWGSQAQTQAQTPAQTQAQPQAQPQAPPQAPPQATPPAQRPPSPSYPPSSRTPPPPPPPPPHIPSHSEVISQESGPTSENETRMYVSFRLLPAFASLAAPPSEFEPLTPDTVTRRGRAG